MDLKNTSSVILGNPITTLNVWNIPDRRIEIPMQASSIGRRIKSRGYLSGNRSFLCLTKIFVHCVIKQFLCLLNGFGYGFLLLLNRLNLGSK